jgi:uroporphyrinogen-III synthase
VSELPLAGRQVLVTRARHQAGQLSEKLRALGAEVVEMPAIEIVAPESYAELDWALGNLSQYAWLIVTSANGAQALGGRMLALGIGAGEFVHLRIAAVGSGTARALGDLGLAVAVTPAEYVAESLVESLGGRVRGERVLLARADSGRVASAGGDGGCCGCLSDGDSCGICNFDAHNLRAGRADSGCSYVYKLIDSYKFPQFSA